MKSKKNIYLMFIIMLLLIITVGASFAFFQYSKTSRNKITISAGDIQFSYFEAKDSISISNMYPVSDEIGRNDITHDYKFEVSLTSTSTSTLKYNVKLVSNNLDDSLNYFNNQNIKYALLRSDDDTTYTYVADTDSIPSKVLSDIEGFEVDSHEGVGTILESQSINSLENHFYKLRFWISDQTNYSNTINGQDEPTSVGKYNNFTYSLKVKIDTEENTPLTANNVSYQNVNSPNNCLDVECSLNELFEMIN